MDLTKDNLAVLLVTERGALRGRVKRVPADVTIDPNREFLELTDVTIFDRDHRIVQKCQQLSMNRRFIVWAMEDDLGPGIEAIKSHLATEDFESARQEVERLMPIGGKDAELLYVAGVVYGNMGQEELARSLFNTALGLTLDERLRRVITGHMNPADEAGS